jgi:hypothetical protein
LAKLAVVPPIEVVLKRMHSGTSKHRYFAMAGYTFADEDAYPQAIVRFDWRNPLQDDKGKRLQDEILPNPVADWFSDTAGARWTAMKVYEAPANFLEQRDIVCYDLCLFITEDGTTVFGEISQDCGRFRHFDLGSLDKDVWRSGGSSDEVLKKWSLLLEFIEKQGAR